MPWSKSAIERKGSLEGLREEHERLRAALAIERAAVVVVRAGIPPSFVQLLAVTPPEEQERRAQQIAAELAERSGHPAAGSGPWNQEAGAFTTGPGGGDLEVQVIEGEVEGEDQDLPPERLGALAAVTRSGAEGGEPPTPPAAGKDARSEAIRSSRTWEELEQAVRPGRG